MSSGLGTLSLLWMGSLVGAGAAVPAAVNLLTPLAGFGVSGLGLNVVGKDGWLPGSPAERLAAFLERHLSRRRALRSIG